jgi:hypothetical protein
VRQQKRRALGSVVLGLGAVLALAGCGAGQITQTDTQEPAVNGAFAQAGEIMLLDAALYFPPAQPGNEPGSEVYYYPAGSDAPLNLRIVNVSGQADELVDVTSDAATSVSVQGSRQIPGGAALVVGSPVEAAEPGQQSSSATPSESPSAPSSSADASDSGASESNQPAENPATVPPPGQGGKNSADTVGKAEIVLQGLTRDLRPGQLLDVTFTFRNAGPVTVEVPITAPDFGRVPEDHSGPGGHGEGGHGESAESGGH